VLAAKITAGRETVYDLEVAAEDRYEDALTLLVRGQWTGCTYLAGYVGELIVKAAVLRLSRVAQHAEALPELKKARRAHATAPLRTLHEIDAWMQVLLEIRRAQNQPLPKTVHTDVTTAASVLAADWAVELRYYGVEVDGPHARGVFDAASTLRHHQPALWR
jgi:hypothetical protein